MDRIQHRSVVLVIFIIFSPDPHTDIAVRVSMVAQFGIIAAGKLARAGIKPGYN